MTLLLIPCPSEMMEAKNASLAEFNLDEMTYPFEIEPLARTAIKK